MNHFIASLCLILLSLFAKAQLPGNFNLIGDATLNFIAEKIGAVADTSFNESCWVKAGRYETLIDNGFYAYRDTTKKIVVIDPHHDYYSFDIEQPRISKYKISTKTTLDSSGTPYTRRAYVQNHLYEPLKAGKTYTFTIYNLLYTQSVESYLETSMLQSLGIMKNLNILFSDTQIKQFTNRERIDLIPQINFRDWTGSKIDTSEIIKLTAQYTAHGGEQFLTIGNFDYFSDLIVNLSPAQLYYFYADSLGIGGFNDVFIIPPWSPTLPSR